MKKSLLFLTVGILFAGHQVLFACSAAYYRTTIQCGCGGTDDIYECQSVNFNSSCTTCNACGFSCCGNFYCNSCNTGSGCLVRPSASLSQHGALLAAGSGGRCVDHNSFEFLSKPTAAHKSKEGKEGKVPKGREAKTTT